MLTILRSVAEGGGRGVGLPSVGGEWSLLTARPKEDVELMESLAQLEIKALVGLFARFQQ